MILQETFPRATVFWILIAQLVVYLPHFASMPLWLSALYVACLAWRFGIYQGRFTYPNGWMKFLLIAAAFIGVLASFQTISGAKGGVALLLIAFALKTLEMKEQRDAYVVVMLAYFVVACAFLFQRSFFAAAYLLACLAVVSAALVSMNHLPRKSLDLQGLWLSVKMLLQAVPLMVFLFVFFPQLPPLFQLNLGGSEATTGLSDTMTPGSISELTRSGELAFRVKFKDKVPANKDLYWRAQIFERFDGIGWEMSDQKPSTLKKNDIFSAIEKAASSDSVFEYEIYQEASDQKMLFSLATPWSDNRKVQLNTDFTLSSNKIVSNLFRYQVKSNLAYQKDVELDEIQRIINLNIPRYGNERSREYAVELRKKSNSDHDYMQVVLANYLESEFEYSLRPPILGANPVDEFIFETRKGFCEHFASSFVYLMRAGGIPARVVAGYMGGEYNENGDYMLVHQFDAHAWSEVWMEGSGWVRVDPTAWVAPDRINQGIEEALPEGESILEGNLMSARKYNPLTELRLRLDYLNMQWDKWVLGYDEKKQQEVINKLLGKVTAERITLFVFICFAFVVLSTSLTIFIKDYFRVKDPADRLYFRMEKRLKRKLKISRDASETPNAFADRVKDIDGSLGESVANFSASYIKLKYQRLKQNSERNFLLGEMKKALRQM